MEDQTVNTCSICARKIAAKDVVSCAGQCGAGLCRHCAGELLEQIGDWTCASCSCDDHAVVQDNACHHCGVVGAVALRCLEDCGKTLCEACAKWMNRSNLDENDWICDDCKARVITTFELVDAAVRGESSKIH